MIRLIPFIMLCLSCQSQGADQPTEAPMEEAKAEESPILMYVFDPLCGWCYGFSPVIQEFSELYASEFEVEVVSGGMITGEREGPIGEVAAYISSAYLEVENHTGVEFGDAFLNEVLAEGTAQFSSVPSSQAMAVFAQIQPKQALAFASALQKAIYYDGLPPTDWAGLGALSEDFGVDPAAFTEAIQSDSATQLAARGFAISNQLGVTGFPAVFLVYDNQAFPIARGYLPLSELKKNYLAAREHFGLEVD